MSRTIPEGHTVFRMLDSSIRTRMTEKPFKGWEGPAPKQTASFKPHGLWYAFGGAWYDWCYDNEPEWVRKYAARLDVDESRILVVHDIPAFSMKYAWRGHDVAHVLPTHVPLIDWAAVASDGWLGVELPKYQWEHRFKFTWFYAWDVASGCIWDPAALKGWKPL